MILPPVGWALANIISLAVGVDSNSTDSGKFTQGLDFSSYLRVVIVLAENLLTCFERVNGEELVKLADSISLNTGNQSKILFTDLLKPVCQQWHLMKLLTLNKDSSIQKAECELTDVAYYYSCMLRIFSILSPVVGSMPILNMLSFTPGFLLNLWGPLEKSFFPKLSSANDANFSNSNIAVNSRDGISKKKKKWVNVLNKISGKSQGDIEQIESVSNHETQTIGDDPSDVWDIESLRGGPEGLTTDSAHLIHLFCATYSHLLLVLDDIEFYDKQVVTSFAHKISTCPLCL